MDSITIEHNVTPAKLDVLYVDDWPVWTKGVSEFDWTYDQKETCYIVEGKAIVTPEGEEPVTITDRNMTRFIMSIQEAVRLVIDSARLAKGGEVFVTKMPTIRIQDLAEVMIRELAPKYGYKIEDIGIEYIGSKPGEKMYEELMNNEEIRRALELERYFVVMPAFRGLYRNIAYEYPNIVSHKVTNPYHSGNEEPLSQGQLLDFLRENELLEETEEKGHPAERHWPNH